MGKKFKLVEKLQEYYNELPYTFYLVSLIDNSFCICFLSLSLCFSLSLYIYIYAHGGSGVKHLSQCRRRRFNPWVRKTPWKRKWLPTPVFLPGEFHGQRSLVDCSPRGHKRVRHELATKQQYMYHTKYMSIYNYSYSYFFCTI